LIVWRISDPVAHAKRDHEDARKAFGFFGDRTISIFNPKTILLVYPSGEYRNRTDDLLLAKQAL
jgi:hypothetical protein